MMQFERLSDWIEVQYVEDEENPEELVPAFEFDGAVYHLGRFMRARNNPWSSDLDVPEYIHGYDCHTHYRPYFIEISNDGEAVRVYDLLGE